MTVATSLQTSVMLHPSKKERFYLRVKDGFLTDKLEATELIL